jgi:hypothetical protein
LEQEEQQQLVQEMLEQIQYLDQLLLQVVEVVVNHP